MTDPETNRVKGIQNPRTPPAQMLEELQETVNTEIMRFNSVGEILTAPVTLFINKGWKPGI